MIDEYLLSGYISAITILGKQLFSDGLDENNEFHEINFGGISAYFHFHKDIQFSFFVNNLIKSNIQEVDAKTSQTTKKILKKYEDLLNSELPLDDYIQTDIDNIVNSLRSKSVNTKKTKTVPSKIVIFGNSLPKLNSFFKKYKKQFMVKRFFNYNRMIGYLIHNEVDTLIINQNYKEETWNFNYASQIKEVRPDIHLIALIEEYRLDYLLKILNSDYLDFVISYKDNLDQYHIIISKACQSTVEMKKKVSYTTENLLSITQRNPFYTRSMLKSHKSSYELTKIPELYGLFISRENLPYYCKFWPKGGGEFNIDQDLFAGFITSLTTVSYEMFLGEGHYAGLKVGNANVIIRDQFDFTFVFFLGNVDHTNINLIQKHLETTIFLLYDLIHQSEKKYLYEAVGEDLTELLEQHATELFLQFSSLNLINY
ncbi:MAG: hypothetical protein OEY49_01930 [Candidatus Heimdallarchaeota archaeon]|nr:hypothetical protein [Candidatus Heimdallarchaeota archaeon]